MVSGIKTKLDIVKLNADENLVVIFVCFILMVVFCHTTSFRLVKVYLKFTSHKSHAELNNIVIF